MKCKRIPSPILCKVYPTVHTYLIIVRHLKLRCLIKCENPKNVSKYAIYKKFC